MLWIFSCSLWDQGPPFRDLCPAALAKFGAEALKVLTSNKFHESKAAEEGESNLLGKKIMGVSGQRHTRRQDGVRDTDTHSVMCICVRSGWVAGTQWDPTAMTHGAGYMPSPQVSGPWGCQRGCPQGLSQVPGGMAEEHLHAAFSVIRCVSHPLPGR